MSKANALMKQLRERNAAEASNNKKGKLQKSSSKNIKESTNNEKEKEENNSETNSNQKEEEEIPPTVNDTSNNAPVNNQEETNALNKETPENNEDNQMQQENEKQKDAEAQNERQISVNEIAKLKENEKQKELEKQKEIKEIEKQQKKGNYRPSVAFGIQAARKRSAKDDKNFYVKLILARNRFMKGKGEEELNIYKKILNLEKELRGHKDYPKEYYDAINEAMEKVALPKHVINDTDVQDFIPEDQFVPKFKEPIPLDQLFQSMGLK